MGQRDDEELLGYIASGLKMISSGVDSALQGKERFWAYHEQWLRRRRPKKEYEPAAPREVIEPLIKRIDRAAGDHAMAYEALLTAQEVAEFLGLQKTSVLQLVSARHMSGVKIGSRVLVKLGELRRYLEEGPGFEAHSRPEWRPLIEEFPGIRKAAEAEARTEVLRQRYDAVTIKDLRNMLDLEWGEFDRLERKGVIESFRVEEPNSWSMVKRSEIPRIEAHVREEREEKARRRAERAAARREAAKEPRIRL